jgi:hypothetical protein
MSACSQCGAEFSCGLVDGAAASQCWCMALPVMAKESLLLDADGSMQSCMCAACLLALHEKSGKENQPN